MSNTKETVTKSNPRGGRPISKQAKAASTAAAKARTFDNFDNALAITPALAEWAEQNNYHLQWMRFSYQGYLDNQHLEVISRKGYAPVTLDEVPGADLYQHSNPFTGRFEDKGLKSSGAGIPGVITQKDVVLCKIDKDVYEERQGKKISLAQQLHASDKQKLKDASDAMGDIAEGTLEENYHSSGF